MRNAEINDFSVSHAASVLSGIRQLTIERDVQVAKLTRIRAVGTADLLVRPHTRDSLIELIDTVHTFGWPLTVIGCASNILVSDRGIRGITCWLNPSFSSIRGEGNRLICESGAPLCDVAAWAARHSLGGFEFACGIPGSIGGAVFMNAGAFGGSMSDVIARTTYIDGGGKVSTVEGDAHNFGYRHSFFADCPDAVIIETELVLDYTDRPAIYEKMAEFAHRRYLSQPLEAYSAGSAFRRPEGYFAGKLISDAGMKGYRRGNAGVSAKHAGFIINYGNAASEEIVRVFQDVRKAVYAMEGVRLKPEVRLIGDWESDPFAFDL